MDEIRLCVVSPLYHPVLGGVGRQAVALTEYLSRSGVSAIVICREITGLPDWMPAKEVHRVGLKTLGGKKHDLEERSIANLLISLSFCFGLLYTLVRMKNQYNIVHFHGASLPLVFCTLPLTWMGKRIVAKVAGAKMKIEAGSFRGTYLGLGNIFIRILRRVHAFVAITGEIRDDLIADGFQRERIFESTNFIVQSEFFPVESAAGKSALRTRLGIPVDRTVLIFSGRLVRRKRVDMLLKAVARVAERFPSIYCLVLGHGELRQMLEEEAHVLGIWNMVDFRGFVSNIREYLQASDMFVFSSEKEGMPNALLEAMACHLPVISTRIGGITDILRHLENGLLFPPGDYIACAEAIGSLIEEHTLSERLSKAGHATVMSHYSVDSVCQRYLELYRKVLDEE